MLCAGSSTKFLLCPHLVCSATEALNSREFDKALSLLNLLVDKCPASLEIRLKRIEAQLGLRKYEEAGAAATDLMSKHGSTDPRLLVMKARVMAQLGNSGGATKYLQVGAALRFISLFFSSWGGATKYLQMGAILRSVWSYSSLGLGHEVGAVYYDVFMFYRRTDCCMFVQ